MNYFTKDELSCPCPCGIYNVEQSALNTLCLIREEIGRAMWVTSGCRCPQHNRDIGGSEKSGHITTETNPSTEFDIYCAGGGFKYDLVGLCYKYKVPRIGVYLSDIVHIGFSKVLPQQVMWVMK